MSYQVLARKLRPQTFDEVVAQDHITNTLRNAIRSNRIAHAYLFCGTRGTGKTTTARILAKALNCVEGPTPRPCLKCSNCREIASSSSMDVIEIDAASNTGVDDIRGLRENVRYAPAGSRYKIYIIDEVHRLSAAAFDALLKTLEEPPDHVVFIFATTEPHNLPATILSRTQRYDFRRIPLADITASLRQAADKESVRIDEDALALAARKGDGSMRDALSLFEQILAYADGEITVELIADALGLVDLNTLFDLTRALHERDFRALLDHVSCLVESGSDIGQFLIDFQEHLRNLLISTVVSEPSRFIELSDPYLKRYEEQKGFFSESDIMRMVKVISDLRLQLKEGAEPRFFLEIALLRLAKMDKTATLKEVIDKLAELSGGGSTGSSPPADLFERGAASSPSPAAAEDPGSDPGAGPVAPSVRTASIGSADDLWAGFLDEYTQVNGVLSAILRRGRVQRADENILQLVFPGDAGVDKLLTSEKVRQLESSMERHFGRHLKFRFGTDPNLSVSGPRTNSDPRFDLSPAELLDRNPEVRKIVERCDGEITSIKKLNSGGVADG